MIALNAWKINVSHLKKAKSIAKIVVSCYIDEIFVYIDTPMKTYDNITLCLTIGKRPDELRQTLHSLLDKVAFAHIIAINDFGDEETNAVFRELCPQGELICLGYNIGHHKACDYMYAKITTPYVFHCEDDWLFDSTPDIEQIIELLDNTPSISAVTLRTIEDMGLSAEQSKLVRHVSAPPIDIAYLSDIHEQWYGYSFNPHIARLDTWKAIAPFAKFKKERHISRALRQQGKHMVFLAQGNCHHIGWENSLANPPKKTWFAKVKAKVFG